VTGLSRGGMMAYRVACELSAELAAIAPVAGNMADETGSVDSVGCQPDRPVSVFAVHGADDAVVPVQGRGRYAPLEDVIGRWRGLNGCEPAATETINGRIATRTWRCRQGSEVRATILEGIGHTWPGIPLTSLPWDPPLDATAAIAEFFAAHTRASATAPDS
jgi:polyhydroxybutyrate depolymerase